MVEGLAVLRMSRTQFEQKSSNITMYGNWIAQSPEQVHRSQMWLKDKGQHHFFKRRSLLMLNFVKYPKGLK